MITKCTQSLSNTRYHQFQLITDDDNKLIKSYEFANVGSLKYEDDPSNAWLIITWNKLVIKVLTRSGLSPNPQCQA